MWIDAGFRFIRSLTVAASLSALICSPAYAARQSWSTLTPMQQQALAPLVAQWDTMPDKQQKRLLATTKRYPQLTPEQKQLFLTRLTEWSKLTPEQRNRAREKYKAFSKVPPDKREEVKRMVRQSEAEKNPAAAASGVTPAN
jgi:hypothetical protein